VSQLACFIEYYYGDKVKEDEMGEMRNAYKIFIRKPEGKKPL
jgi:hypothetical protein